VSRRRYDVCAAVVSDLPYDARVWKEARSLAGAGYALRLVGTRYGGGGVRAEGDVDVLEVALGERGRRSLLRTAVAVCRVWLAVLRTPARVYHAHNVHVLPPAFLASRLRRAALVYDAHELYGETSARAGLRSRLAAAAGRLGERVAVRRADAVITTNPSRARVLTERHGRSHVHVLANVPALVTELEPIDPGYPKDGPVLLYQGGVYPRSRALEETVQALAYLPGAQLVLLGFGRPELFAQLRTLAEETGVSSRVTFLPPRPFDELVRTAAAADVGLVPIKPEGTNELLGDTNKLHEYLMAGLPVAASDLPEIRRVALAGDPPVGEVFDPSSPESIAAAVERLLADPELHGRRRAEARRLARESHNWQLEETRLLALYADLARPAAPPAPQPVDVGA
jgi:glycosyltransferase involved in cell wall biosynthesis